MTPLLWLAFGIAAFFGLLLILSLCGVSGQISEQERQRDDALVSRYIRLNAAAQAIVDAASKGRPGTSTYVPCDLLWTLEDALTDDRATHPESHFDRVGEP